MTVLGDQNLGYFASLMKLYYGNETSVDSIRYNNLTVATTTTAVTTLNSGVNTQTIGAYWEGNTSKTAFALSTNFGAGKLIYINSGPSQTIINASPSDLKWQLLSEMGKLIGSIAGAQPTDYSAISKWNYDIAQDATLTGTVNVSTTQLPFAVTTIQTDNITLSSNSSKSTQITNVTITSINVQGTTGSTITANRTQFSSFSTGSYTALDFPDGCQWTIKLDDDSSVAINYNNGTGIHTVTAKGGTINLHSPSTTLLTNKPRITVQGQTNFTKAYIGWIGSTDKVPSEGDQFTIKGNASFTIDCMDRTTALLSNLVYTGSASTSKAASIIPWNEMDIPWYTILTSPYHLLLITSIIVAILAWFGLSKLKACKR